MIHIVRIIIVDDLDVPMLGSLRSALVLITQALGSYRKLLLLLHT